jgi:hypothetical protein
MFADYLRLNVGPVEVLQLWETGAKFEFQAPLDLPPGHDIKVHIPSGGGPILPAVPVPSGVCVVPPRALLSMPPALRQAHDTYIRAAASRRAVTRYKDAYSPAIVEYLKRVTGEALPHPSYYKASKEEADAEDHISATLERRAGFQSDAVIRKALDHLAMQAAKSYLVDAGHRKIEDTSEFKPYDFTCERNGCVFFVEVKGTQTRGDAVVLTDNEKAHAEQNPTNSILFVLHSVKVRTGTKPKASGGTQRIIDPWHISQGTLKPIDWIYTLPG